MPLSKERTGKLQNCFQLCPSPARALTSATSIRDQERKTKHDVINSFPAIMTSYDVHGHEFTSKQKDATGRLAPALTVDAGTYSREARFQKMDKNLNRTGPRPLVQNQLTIYFWWSLCNLYLNACQVRFTVGTRVYAVVLVLRTSSAN